MITPSGPSLCQPSYNRTLPDEHTPVFLILRFPSKGMESILASLHHSRRSSVFHGSQLDPALLTTRQVKLKRREV
jgi:hypothetical protein